jgi:hypothetical protein
MALKRFKMALKIAVKLLEIAVKINAPAGPLGHFKSAVPAHPIPENYI